MSKEECVFVAYPWRLVVGIGVSKEEDERDRAAPP